MCWETPTCSGGVSSKVALNFLPQLPEVEDVFLFTYWDTGYKKWNVTPNLYCHLLQASCNRIPTKLSNTAFTPTKHLVSLKDNCFGGWSKQGSMTFTQTLNLKIYRCYRPAGVPTHWCFAQMSSIFLNHQLKNPSYHDFWSP